MNQHISNQKQIPLLGDNINFYHKRTDSAIEVRPRFFDDGKPMMSSDGKTPATYKVGKSNVTGFYKGDIAPGDQLYFNKFDVHTVTEVVLRRNHAGEFTNPEDKKGTYFEVNCDFIKF